MFINGKLVKTGKKPPVIDKRTLKVSNYLLDKILPTPPTVVSWITKLEAAETFPMYYNDTLGTCVEAAGGHMFQQWNYYAGRPWEPTEAQVLKTYEDVGGYVPGDPSTDNGTDMLSYLKYLQKTGIGGHKIAAYMSVDFTSLAEVQLVIQLFGNVFLGVGLPVSAEGKNDWTVPQGGIYTSNGAPGGWGGHCIPLVAGSQVTKTCVTWGTVLKMSNNFLLDYADEAYAVLSTDWLTAGKISPSNFNLAQLQQDLSELGVEWPVQNSTS